MKTKFVVPTLVVAAVLLAFTGTTAFAGTAHGIAKRPLTQEQFAVACEKGDPEHVLNVSCDQVVAWFKVYRADVRIENANELAKYVRSLTVVSCGDGGKHSFNREVDGKILHEAQSSRWEREFGVGEECLYDNNRAEIQFSTSCYNTPYEKIGVNAPSVPPPTAVGAVATPSPSPVASLAEAAKNRVERDSDNAFNLSVTVNNNEDHGHMTALVIAGSILLAVGAAIAYDHSKNNSSASKTPQPKIYTNPTGFRVTIPLGGS